MLEAGAFGRLCRRARNDVFLGEEPTLTDFQDTSKAAEASCGPLKDWGPTPNTLWQYETV